MLKEFTINRAKWLVPETSNQKSCLLAADKKMCCLGQLAIASGLTPRKIKNIDSILGLELKAKYNSEKFRAFVEKFDGLLDASNYDDLKNSRVAFNLMALNDTRVGGQFEYMFKNGNEKVIKVKSQEYKEDLLTKEFAKIGIKVNFTGELKLLDR